MRFYPMFALQLLASPTGRGGTACRDGEGDGMKSPLSDALRRQLSPGESHSKHRAINAALSYVRIIFDSLSLWERWHGLP